MNCWIELSKKALLNNLKIFQSLVSKDKVAPVIKSNAYGHGLKEIYSIIKNEDIKWLCVAYLDEAKVLRDLGYNNNILIVAPIFPQDFSKAKALNVDIILGTKNHLYVWETLDNPPRAHLKFDTGLSRQGFFASEARDIAEIVVKSKFKDHIVGICTHFANVEDVTQQDFSLKQLQQFQDICNVFDNYGIYLIKHAASSASSLILEQSRFDMIRVGISLYGLWPSQPTRISYLQLYSKLINLMPVLSLKTKIFYIKYIKKGQCIGYGCTYKAMKDMLIGILPIGYNEGISRLIGESQSYVLVNNYRAPIVGRISMNMITIDVTDIPDVKENDIVTLIGQDQTEYINPATLGEWSYTIHYEIITRLSPFIPRRIID